MQASSEAERERIDGLAAFAAAAFAVGVGVIAALERVGAPDGLVEALGPLFAFSVSSFIGLSNRAASLTDFLAARRAIPSGYAAIGFAARAGGAALVFATGSSAPTPWLALAIGAALSGVVVAPAIRGANVSGLVDVLATRFPAPAPRLAFGFALFAFGALTAAAGFQLAAQALAVAIGGNVRIGAAFALCALLFTVPPGGAKSVAWSDAASGGGALLIAAFGAALALLWLPAPFAPLAQALENLASEARAARGDPALAVSLAVAIGFFFPLLSPAMATPSSSDARRAGVSGVVLAGLGLAATAIALPTLAAAPESARHTGQALLSAATWLPSLALARAGIVAASRGAGIDLERAYSSLTVLATRRIAVQRLAMILTIGLCPFALERLRLSPDRALTFAVAGSLAFLTPSTLLALVLPGRASNASAIAAVLAAGGALYALFQTDPSGFSGFGLVDEAMIAALLALTLGALAAFALPSRGGRRSAPAADPFLDMPLDPADAGR